MLKKCLAVTGMLTLIGTPSWTLHSQGRTPAAPGLTALDYIEIQQLVSKYPWAIDNCTNNGYDYADLYVSDGMFMNSLSPNRWVGRDRLAEAAGGGPRGCKKLTDASNANRTHTIGNLVIEPSIEGAIGRSYLIYPGVEGGHSDPQHAGHVGGYQDVYVKTSQGWRFKSRVHVFPPTVPGTFTIPEASAAPVGRGAAAPAR
ncbi:MAG: nuclear transport factor 2 family protein [Acidobacteriota bacterium]